MKKLFAGLAALLVLPLIVASCSSARQSGPLPAPVTTTAPSTGKVVPPAPPAAYPAPTVVPRPTPTPAPPPSISVGSAGADYSSVSFDVDRMVVRTGQLSLLVEDISGTLDRIAAVAQGHKGYVVSSNSWREGERLRGTISIRVPSADCDSVMKEVAALATEVTQQTTSSKDVTEEYTDLTSRLKNLEATEQQLLKIMERATKIEDVIVIQREITNTRAQIEQTKGRMVYLERTTATSLININLEQAKLQVKFNTTGGRVVQVGDTVRLVSQVVGGYVPYSYQWDFGDGDTSTEATPSHSYKSAGNYTVSLKVTDNRGNTATETTKDYINVVAVPGWNAGNVASGAWNALAAFGRGLANVVIWLGVWSPVWIVIGGGAGYLIWRRRRKKA